MGRRRRRIRKNKNGLITPRKLLEDGDWRQLTFDEKVFTCLVWCGFTNQEAWQVINPLSEAAPNSRAVMAGRYSAQPQIKNYIKLLNDGVRDALFEFKGQKWKIGEWQCMDAVANYRAAQEKGVTYKPGEQY